MNDLTTEVPTRDFATALDYARGAVASWGLKAIAYQDEFAEEREASINAAFCAGMVVVLEAVAAFHQEPGADHMDEIINGKFFEGVFKNFKDGGVVFVTSTSAAYVEGLCIPQGKQGANL